MGHALVPARLDAGQAGSGIKHSLSLTDSNKVILQEQYSDSHLIASSGYHAFHVIPYYQLWLT